MGHIVHDAVIVTGMVFGEDQPPDIAAFRESLPEEWRPLVIGPVKSITNGYLTFVFLPDGSKSGWETDAAGDGFREQFVNLFQESKTSWGYCPWDIIELGYGADHEGEPMVMAYGRSDP